LLKNLLEKNGINTECLTMKWFIFVKSNYLQHKLPRALLKEPLVLEFFHIIKLKPVVWNTVINDMRDEE
jgi:hypothetical protein